MTALVVVAFALGAQFNLIGNAGDWSGNTDRPGATMTVSLNDGVLAADIVSEGGGQETFPKLICKEFETPQDWRDYTRLNVRMRVVSTDPRVKTKPMAFVFYDEKTRRTDLPTNEMTQQIISHSIPVGEWVDAKCWLGDIRRSAIRRMVVYLYEMPPPSAHSYRWEFATLELEKVDGDAEVLEGAPKLEHTSSTQAASITTSDGLRLSLDAKGNVANVECDAQRLGGGSAEPTGLLVRDVGNNGPVLRVGGEVKQEQGVIRQASHLEDAGLNVVATYRSAGPCVEVQGMVSDTRGQERAVTVYFALPVADGPWTWWDSVAASRTASDNDRVLGYFEGGVGYGLRGEHSKYPLGAITWPGNGGLTFAIRMDEPMVHRIAYVPKLRLFYIAFDFGLVPEKRIDGRPLSEAPFRFLVYRHDPAWGFR
ncbi:MAG: hypothetical protein K1Y02_24695, partial [Candidatus Hydrogenedentes bacterium]|nr:hypothetical protein [Candidatus Hydrogenedentota bacterium]